MFNRRQRNSLPSYTAAVNTNLLQVFLDKVLVLLEISQFFGDFRDAKLRLTGLSIAEDRLLVIK